MTESNLKFLNYVNTIYKKYNVMQQNIKQY